MPRADGIWVIGQRLPGRVASCVMPLVRTVRLATVSVAAAAAAFVIGGPAATQASADTYPADCTVANLSPAPTRAMTCTDRPATQQWQIFLNCSFGQADKDVYGNVVTGNGTSTAHCPVTSWEVLVLFQAD
jgi:hypothetical protein